GVVPGREPVEGHAARDGRGAEWDRQWLLIDIDRCGHRGRASEEQQDDDDRPPGDAKEEQRRGTQGQHHRQTGPDRTVGRSFFCALQVDLPAWGVPKRYLVHFVSSLVMPRPPWLASTAPS